MPRHHIRILGFTGCPNYEPVAAMARRLVEANHLDAEIERVKVSPDDVVRLRFLGSPTVQVDGVDVERAARERTDFAMSCRVYDTPDGLPSEKMFMDALGVSAATEPTPTNGRAGFMAIGGSVGTAMLSSACCWLPLLLLAFLGASAAGASALFEQWRPVFIGVAVVMLGFGYYLNYFRKSSCTGGCCNTGRQRGRRFQRATLWVSAVIVAAFIFFPNYVGVILGGGGESASVSAAEVSEVNTQESTFNIEGMYCAGCATRLESVLAGTDGVRRVSVNYDNNLAVVLYDPNRIDSDSMRERIRTIGFTPVADDRVE